MDKINKIHSFSLYADYVMSLFILIIGISMYKYEKSTSIAIMVLSSLLIYSIYLKNTRTKKYLQYFIKCTDEIIENKSKNIRSIDGEGEISVLSHKLYVLNQRYEQMINVILEDKKNLQEYMENIAHQLKIPITTMKINEEMLMQKENNHYLTVIYNQTQKLNILVDELLTLASLEANTLVFDIRKNNLEDIFNDIEDNLLELCMQNEVTLQLHTNVEQINCDRKWMIEAIENIIKNCIEKNKNSTIDIFVEQNQNILKIIIQDHGEGFQEIEHLFDRFHKSKESQGYGLGLAISKEIVEKHHGMMSAKNENGAVFEIILPVILSKKKI